MESDVKSLLTNEERERVKRALLGLIEECASGGLIPGFWVRIPEGPPVNMQVRPRVWPFLF